MQGKFVTFEGTDGAGKTTVLNKVIEHLKDELDDRLTVTREPGGNRISEEIRSIILEKDNTEMDPRTEALLYAAARRQHMIETVWPALDKGDLVLCDRYVDSSIAYQGEGRQIGYNSVLKMNQFAIENKMPDLTIYFDIPVETGLSRINKYRDNDEINRLDLENMQFYQRVHDAYDKIENEFSQRIVKVDATKSIDEVVKDVLSILNDRIITKYY
ncbi:dTMP kinase [Lactobacillus sp. S2-2]|uniref:dTMP kinase n=1 Tax=Lactobacillus sp. S2-2 TaxID=2692917 RepID=UPI001F0069FB|nr:dTMP kinase [Lactobacillus sp. S2-2]MCF6515661.1 dTMP kinase [Lactobacillus sp. S2-2]